MEQLVPKCKVEKEKKNLINIQESLVCCYSVTSNSVFKSRLQAVDLETITRHKIANTPDLQI